MKTFPLNNLTRFTSRLATKLLLAVVLLSILSPSIFAQGVAINADSTNPDPSAILDVKSTTQGMLVPRMTEAQRNAVIAPAIGLLIYQTNQAAGFYYYNGSVWTSTSAGATGAFETVSGVTSNSPGAVNTDDLVFGSTQINDQPGTADDARMYFDKSKGAFRAGGVNDTKWDDANVGTYSAAFGVFNKVSGSFSAAWGDNHDVTGNHATAWGSANIASAARSTSFGLFTTASGQQATAWGGSTIASNTQATAFGATDTASGQRSTVWGSGNHASASEATAFGVTNQAFGQRSTAWGRGNGATNTESTCWGGFNRASGTRATAFGGVNVASGPTSTAWGNSNTVSGSAATAFGADNEAFGVNSLAFGLNNNASGYNSTTFGSQNISSGEESTTWGRSNQATALRATAWGNGNQVTSPDATAFGFNNVAGGTYATVFGWNNFATGGASTATGQDVHARSLAEFTVGLNTLDYIPASRSAWQSADRVFVVGNGMSTSSRSNAFIVFKSGNALLAGTLVQNSDRRLKTNIKPLQSTLENVLELGGYSYNWINTEQRGDALQIGVIAQEVQALYPELVSLGEDGFLSVNYNGLVPVLIEATKEQQQLIQKQQEEIDALKALNTAESSSMKAQVEDLQGQINQIQAALQQGNSANSTVSK